MPSPDERDANKAQREQDRELAAAERAVRKQERQAENERRKAAGQPALPDEPDDGSAPHPDQTLP